MFEAIREIGFCHLGDVQASDELEAEVQLEVRKKVGCQEEKYLIPKVTKQAVDFLLGFLDVGTWTVVGDKSRVYRGPNFVCEGWQRNTVATPEALSGARWLGRGC